MEHAYVEIIEQPVPAGARFRYKCEGRSAGCIRGVNSSEECKTYPTIKVHGYHGAACVVVSCVTNDGPPYYPHPHSLVGKTCKNGVCYKPINNFDMICSFPNIGIQYIKRNDIKDSLAQREALQIDPFGTGFSHYSVPSDINLNALRLCFQVFIPDSNGKLCVPLPPVISASIFDNKTVSHLTITKLSHCSAAVTGGEDIILLCDKVNKNDIQIVFYEEKDKEVIWFALGKFLPHDVHRKVAISFRTPAYKDQNIQTKVNCFIQLRRLSDGTVGKPRKFTLFPVIRDDINARIIKQAIRTKNIYQNDAIHQLVPRYVPENEINSLAPKPVLGNLSFSKNASFPVWNPQLPVSAADAAFPVIPQKVHQINDVLLGAPSAKIGANNIDNFCATSADDTPDKLGQIDLGLNSKELDFNLSGISIDSLSETIGLFSLGLIDAKAADEKISFQGNLKMLRDSKICA